MEEFEILQQFMQNLRDEACLDDPNNRIPINIADLSQNFAMWKLTVMKRDVHQWEIAVGVFLEAIGEEFPELISTTQPTRWADVNASFFEEYIFLRVQNFQEF